MPESTPAVFLSYASQDAEAARRIAESLRASGVTVWFDVEGGLEHGDEWDAKIRRQIKECVLFIPLISANTQARHEGYFRIEWELAAQRAMGIASGVAFILPVVIDATREPDALVPDRFRAVQWTRLPGGVVPPEVQARFLKLWSHRTGVLKHEAVSGGQTTMDGERKTEGGANQSRGRRRTTSALVFAMAALVAVAAIVVWRPWQRSDSDLLARPELARGEPAESVERAPPPISEARQLVAKAWTLMARPEMAREELDAADDLCQRAVALDPNDAEVWAAWSQVDSWYVYHRLERTPARQDGARTKAARALNLSPRSYEARLAQACYLVREGGGQDAVYDLVEAEGLLQSLLRENADEPRALLALGVLYRNTGNVAGFRDAFGRMARTPAFAAQAYSELGWAEFFNGNYREAEAAIDASINLQPYYSNLNLKTYLFAYWWGDLEQAQATLKRLPAANLLEDYAVSTLIQLSYWQRQPDAMLRVLDRLSRDWLESNAFDGPKAWWRGLARQMAGQHAAAQLQWRTALQLVERRLIDQPDSSFLLRWRARLLLACGERTEGEKALRLARELGSRGYFSEEATDEMLLGNKDAAVATLERRVEERERFLNAAILRISPAFDPLRDEPRFKALLARMEADPRFSPHAKAASATAAPSVDQNSVAVLAFANLSDDQNNEYFSDGVSEELLNVLAKIPGLKVTARTSAFLFKGKQVPIADIAQQLGVAYVIEGSVRKQGDRVRITAQLIKAADGFQMWSDSFTRELKDIFAVQDEIAGLIAGQLQLKLGSVAEPRQSVNPEAYRLVLEGHHFWLQRTDEDLARAEGLFQQALALDPNFARAHAGLANVLMIRDWYRLVGGRPSVPADARRARSEVDRALSLDASLAEPHAILGVLLYLEGKHAESEQAFQTALRLNPNYSFGHHWHSHLLMVRGELEAALAEMNRAVQLDPLSFITLLVDSIWHTFAGRYQEALALSDRAREFAPDVFVPLLADRSLIMLQLGRHEEAAALARQVAADLTLQPRWWSDSTALYVLRQAGFEREAADYEVRLLSTVPSDFHLHSYISIAVGRRDEALDQLARQGVRSSNLMTLLYSPLWDDVRDDPRFLKIIADQGLAEAYQAARASRARLLAEPEARP